MSQLLPVGTHTAQVTEVQPGPTHTQLGFESPAGRTACQSIPNAVVQKGLVTLSVDDAKQLKGLSCVIRVERVSSGPGIELARVTACQWLNKSAGTPQHLRIQA
ncbi:hypothetical protein [Deinococcus phoenicis]|uniref:hypothetical protein n=1 Tax=Deinococcus phoenicis TaxID=1476583 RepID=UPI001268F5A4|nr:hypothetical protein [Deinococcus phoenicis]